MLDAQAARYGFAVQHLAVLHPGLDQKATWLRVKVAQPGWVILRSSGVLDRDRPEEAAQVGFPRDKIVGPTPTCTEQDVVPAGKASASSARSGTAGELASRSSRRCSPMSMPGARGRGRQGMSARGRGPVACCAPCSPRRGSARPCATSAAAPDRGAGAVGARTPQPHGCPASGLGRRGCWRRSACRAAIMRGRERAVPAVGRHAVASHQ